MTEAPEPRQLRDHVTRVLTDLPIVGHPTRLHLRLSRFTCNDPGRDVMLFRQRIDWVAAPQASITRRTTMWILQCLAVDKMSVSTVAKALGVGWDVVNALAISAVKHLVHEQSGHLEGCGSSAWTSTSGNMFEDTVTRVSSPSSSTSPQPSTAPVPPGCWT